MKKEIVFSSKFDTSQFDAAISSMQKKLKDLQSGPDMLRMQSQTAERLGTMGMGGMMTQPGRDAFTKATQQSRKELDQMIREQAQGQEKLGKMLSQRVDKLKEMKSAYADLIKLGRDDLDLKEKIGRVEDNNAKLRESYAQRDNNINQLITARQSATPQGIDRLMQAYQGGGMGGVMRAGGRMISQNPGTFAMGLAGVSGVAGAGIGAAGSMYNDYQQSALRTTSSTGNAVQSTVGGDLNNIFGKRSAFEAAFNPERAQAARQALGAESGNRAAAGTGLISNLLAGGARGAAEGGIAGAVGGSVFPGIGTAVGGIGGAVAGGLAGAYNGVTDQQKNLALSYIPGEIGQRYGAQYESGIGAQRGTDYATGLQDLKNQNPGKTLGSRYQEENFRSNLAGQRAMGLGETGLENLQNRTMAAGFTDQMGIEAGTGILGAGGSTRGARMAPTALKAARGLDLTNSTSILGTLSGGMGSGEQSSSSMVKILAEGMKLGLDKSDFREENRRFTQAAADIIAKSGATSGKDVNRISGEFGNYVADKTNKGIEAAQTAFGKFQDISSTTTGRTGVMRAAGIMNDKNFNKLTSVEKDALMKVPDSDLNENNLLVQSAASKAGVSPGEIVKSMRGINANSVSSFKEHDMLRENLKKQGITASSDRSKLTKNQLQDLGKMESMEVSERGYMGQRESESFLNGQLGTGTGGGKTREAGILGQMNGGTGRSGDKVMEDMAQDSKIMVDNFRNFKDEIVPSVKALDQFTGSLKEMMIVLRNASEKDIPAIQKRYATTLSTQHQGGKPKR